MEVKRIEFFHVVTLCTLPLSHPSPFISHPSFHGTTVTNKHHVKSEGSAPIISNQALAAASQPAPEIHINSCRHLALVSLHQGGRAGPALESPPEQLTRCGRFTRDAACSGRVQFLAMCYGDPAQVGPPLSRARRISRVGSHALCPVVIVF